MNRLRVLSIVTGSRAHHAPFVELRHRPRRRACSARVSVGVQHQFADALLGVRQVRVAERLGHQQGEAEHEFALGEVLRRALMRRMRRVVRAVGGAVQQVDVAVAGTRAPTAPRTSSKNTMQSISSKREPSGWSKCERPRSKLSRQRKRRPGVPHGIAKAARTGCGPRCAGRGAANRPRSRRRAAPAWRGRGRRARRCRRLVSRITSQRGAFLQVEHAGDVAAALQVDQRVGQDEVVLADELVIAAHVLRRTRGRFCAEVVRRARPRRRRSRS